jgi:hypothetical protein
MAIDLQTAHTQLWKWCRAQGLAGYDPYDGLNSRLFQALPLRKFRSARLAWIQLHKRSPINFRSLVGIPRERNAKAIALFALAALAAEVLSRDEYLPFARTICDFILNDLHRSEETKDEVCFSYSPIDHTRVFNASLLAGETFATVGKLLGEVSLIEWAQRTARYAVRRQQQNGSWLYGADSHQLWADNFHTAFILTSLSRIIAAGSVPGAIAAGSTGQFDNSLRHGYDYWAERFFLKDGWPKYYPDRLYPADIHSTASAIVALVELRGRIPGTLLLAEQIAQWAIANLRDNDGFFYYQQRRFQKVRIPYMRWSEAWMIYALARLREATGK